MRAVPTELNVLALIKGAERYVFVFDDDSETQLVESIQGQAADPRLSLSWFDALVLTSKAREQVAGASDAAPLPPDRQEAP
jgi:hypothetical protein